jgi:hypothetical protein
MFGVGARFMIGDSAPQTQAVASVNAHARKQQDGAHRCGAASETTWAFRQEPRSRVTDVTGVEFEAA